MGVKGGSFRNDTISGLGIGNGLYDREHFRVHIFRSIRFQEEEE